MIKPGRRHYKHGSTLRVYLPTLNRLLMVDVFFVRLQVSGKSLPVNLHSYSSPLLMPSPHSAVFQGWVCPH